MLAKYGYNGFGYPSICYNTPVARFWLQVRGVPQSLCCHRSRDKRQGFWGQECWFSEIRSCLTQILSADISTNTWSTPLVFPKKPIFKTFLTF